MSRNLALGVAACGAVVAVLLLLYLSALQGGQRGQGEQWVGAPAGTSDGQAREMFRLARYLGSGQSSVPRPVPAASGLIEVPEGLRERIDFWKRVYTEYYSYQAVVHDSREIERVYGLVDLRDEPGVRIGDYASLSRAARRVAARYREHLRFLTATRYDSGHLAGERRRLYLLLQSDGGVAAHRGAVESLRVQRGLRDTMRESIVRSGRYIPHYLRTFREMELPAELVVLPHLESAFRFDARSSAGAVGIWQLTSQASRRLLHINSAVDERLDPWRSAEAAARLLAENHRSLGSWPLAVTAYNQGLTSIRRAVRTTGSRDLVEIIERYRSRSFGFAGRNFYAAFVAVVEVVRNYELYYGSLPIEPEERVERHTLRRSAPLEQICRELGILPRQLASINPALRRLAFNPSTSLPRGLVLNLPAESAGAN